MFSDSRAFSGFAVPDTAAARQFYGETLGLRVDEAAESGILVLKLAGDRDTIVYPKPDHVPATYTILNFPVEDIEEAVDELSRRGVSTLKYDYADERGIMRQGGPLIAWFTDPGGNILSVIQES
jgi:predicted enzyme related to lactoylglutathione lyase